MKLIDLLIILFNFVKLVCGNVGFLFLICGGVLFWFCLLGGVVGEFLLDELGDEVLINKIIL